MIGTNLDLTARREQERALRESEERFRAAYEHAPVGVVILTPDGVIVRANPALCAMTGYSEQELVKLGFDGLTHPDDQQINKGPRSDMEAGRASTVQYEKRYIHKSGRVIWALVSVSAVRDAAGALTAYIGQILDYTLQKLGQAQRDETEARLRQSLQERADAARREAALRRELDHRVRNNLAGLLGLVSLYERAGRGNADAGSSPVSEALRGKILAMREVHELISRSPGSPVALQTLIENLAPQLLSPAQARAVSTSGGQLHIAPAQAGAVAMILQELFTNARKHGAMSTPTGAISIEWKSEPGSDELLLTWRESGGPPAVAPKSFGIGLHLISGFAASELRGGAEFKFARDGFSCILRARLAGPHSLAEHPAPATLIPGT
jgi:PAS domain S-box-containing protein